MAGSGGARQKDALNRHSGPAHDAGRRAYIGRHLWPRLQKSVEQLEAVPASAPLPGPAAESGPGAEPCLPPGGRTDIHR